MHSGAHETGKDTGPTEDLIGRREERQDLAAFVADQGGPASVRFIEGPPGAGKTALFDYAVDEAESRSLRVYRASPAEAEASLPYAVLGDLFSDVPVSLLDALPSLQRRALESALVHAAADGTDTAQHAVARGLLGVMRALAATDHFVLAIDDVQ
ncbi:MAG: ATP-binding protein, partial [Candidatus Limnocylindrales bacterium]